MSTRIVEIRAKVMKQNDLLAHVLRERFKSAGVSVVGLVSSPGSGKVAFLEAPQRPRPRFPHCGVGRKSRDRK
jgi:hypothetical protein